MAAQDSLAVISCMDFMVFCFLLFAVVAGDGVLDVLVDEGGGLLDPGPDTTSGGVGQVDSERATHHVLHAVQHLAVLRQASALRGQRCGWGGGGGPDPSAEGLDDRVDSVGVEHGSLRSFAGGGGVGC